MYKIYPQPYILLGKIQNYDWGTVNKEAFIPRLLKIEQKKDLPYAEYWIGVHPKAPSEIILEGEKVSLPSVLKQFPFEILGERISKKFNNSLPFLLKVLSVNKALSIQAHPNKKLADALNQRDPVNYPDKNHKPEIAIAIDKLKAIVGLKEPIISLISLKNSISFSGKENQKADLFFGLLIPEAKDKQHDPHVKILAALAEKLKNEHYRNHLKSATNNEMLYSAAIDTINT